MSIACVELCDPDLERARAACLTLLSGPQSFEQVLAPVAYRLAERPPQWRLLEDVLELLKQQLELEPVSRKVLKVIPLLCERLCSLLESSLPVARTGSLEQVQGLLLENMTVLLRRWWAQVDRQTDVAKMQIGFLSHLLVRLLELPLPREQRLVSLRLLQLQAEMESPDTLAAFYPGVCTALAKLLLKSHVNAGKQVLLAACTCLAAWLRAVLVDTKPLVSLAELFSPTATPACSELSLRSSEVVLAVLRSGKAPVRGCFEVSLAGLSSALTREAQAACLEAVFASVSEGQAEAKEFLDSLLEARLERRQELQSRLGDWLQKLLEDLAPRSGIDGQLLERLARLDGLLSFMETAAARGLRWTDYGNRLSRPILRACELTAGGMGQLLRDQRSLASMPGTAISQAEHFVKLFPYELEDSGPEHRDALVAPKLNEDGHQVSGWLARCLRAAGEEHLGRRLLSTLGRLTPLLGVELLCSLFDEQGSAALMALSTFLDHGEDLPLWLVKHCQNMALTSRELSSATCAEDLALQLLASQQLIVSALRALKPGQVHRQAPGLV